MRKLMWFAVGFTAACAAGVYLLTGIWFLLIALVCLIGCAALFFIPTRPAKITAMVLVGCVVGFAWLWGYDQLYLSPARSYDGQTASVVVKASDYSYTPNYGQAFDGYTELDGKHYRVRCYLDAETPILPGTVIRGDFRLRFTASDGRQTPTYYQGKGIFLTASEDGEVTCIAEEPGLVSYPSIWRHKLANLIETAFSPDTAGFAKALLLGDTEDLTYQQERDFQVSGLRHVIAVSGLHVSILFSLIYLAFGRRRVLNAIFGIPLLLVFAAIAGFTPSIVRACLMQGLILLALLVDKEYDPPTALAFAALVILGINPRAITSVSFQLSVGCMIGIFAFSESLRQYFLSFGNLKKLSQGKSKKAKLIRWITGSIAVTLSAMAVTTPLCAIYFGMISLVGVLANLLTLWVISFVFYAVMLTCLATAIWLPLGQGIAWLAGWLIRYVQTVAGWLAEFPLAAVYTDSVYIVAWLVIAYVLLGMFFLLKKKHPGITAAGIMALLCVCIALSWAEPKLDDTRVSVINVGQGQSILLQQKNDCYLVDCGGDHGGITADTVANFLLSQGIFRLDGVILTHYDGDHAGSVLNLLSSIEADTIYMPDVYDSNEIRSEIEKAYPQKIHMIRDNMKIELDQGKITLYPDQTGANDNESSVCVLFQPENCDILITGDRSGSGERTLLQQTQLPELELLIAGHHGSDQATSVELLAATMPKAVAISVGEDNPYGHPRQALLERLSRFGCTVYRTDLHGTIIFRR